jgi:hypothetical protein
VIELDLDTARSRLVIDAIVTQPNEISAINVTLTRSVGFYEEEVPVVEDATVYIEGPDGRLDLVHIGEGIYLEPEESNFTVQPNVDYTLTIIDGTDTYKSTEQLVTVPPIVEIVQEEVQGIPDLLRISAFYEDPPDEENYYLFFYFDQGNEQVDTGDDEFTNGNRTPTIFFVDDVISGTQATIISQGLDKETFEFFNLLLDQTTNGGGGPFGTQPAEVRGNIINVTDEANYPYGYFRVTETFVAEFTLEAPNS